MYENNPALITTIKGTNNIVKDTKKLYLDLFEESRINYNNKQTRDDRKIDNYFNKIANATIHFDESSPHLHIVGVPVKENCKTGMNKQVGKSDVFTIDSLKVIQDEMRECCINDFNKVYNLNANLKEKEEGRNQDYRVSQMNNYDKLKKSYKKQHKKITEINKM